MRFVVPLALLALATPAAAQPWKLERNLAPGTRLRVDEATRTETKLRYTQAGAAAVGDQQVEAWERRYVEEIRSAQPEVLHRSYEVSMRAKHRLQADAPPTQTSVHGRGVIIAGLEWR